MALAGDTISAVREHTAPDWITIAGWSVLGVVTLLVVATFRDYGISWDEMLQNTYGEKLIALYTSGFQDRSAFSYVNLYLYGGLFDMVAAVVTVVSPFGEYETRHLLGGLVFVGGLLGGWKLAALLGGRRAGLVALVCLASTPLLYGHSFINPKDSPFAWLTVWAIYYACRILETPAAPPRGALIGFAVSLGLALATRVMALALIAYLGVIFLALAWAQTRDQGAAALVRGTYRLCLPVAAVLPLALVVMAFFWPWAVTAPFNVVAALETFSHFTWQPKVLWDGELVPSAHLPPLYLTQLLILQLPEHVLAGLVLAGGWCAVHLRHAGADPREVRVRQYGLVILAIVVPLIGFAVLRPVVYNGVRHFLFVVPPIVILGAIGLDQLLTAARARSKALFAVATAAIVIGVTWQGAEMLELHPYEYVSYNVFEGGIKGAEKNFELDYWGTSLGEATRGLVAHIAQNPPAVTPVKVYVCGDRMSVAYFLPDGIEITEDRKAADYFIGINDPPCRDHFENPKDAVFSVQRNGVTLGYAMDLRKGAVP